MHRQHDRVSGRVRIDRGLRTEHLRLACVGRRRPVGATQLRPGVLHAGSVRPVRSVGMWRVGLADVWPEQGATVRVARGRRFRRARAHQTRGAGFVRGLLLRHSGTSFVRHDQTGNNRGKRQPSRKNARSSYNTLLYTCCKNVGPS